MSRLREEFNVAIRTGVVISALIAAMVRMTSRPCRTRNMSSRNSSTSPIVPPVTSCSIRQTSLVRSARS